MALRGGEGGAGGSDSAVAFEQRRENWEKEAEPLRFLTREGLRAYTDPGLIRILQEK